MKTLQKKFFLLLLMLPLGLLAQNTLKGVVLEGSSNQPLPGVNVLVAGTANGTTTDFDGNFTLSNIKKGDKILFSYIGFKEETFIYDEQKSITITLQEDQKELKDVVVIGYGTAKKRDLTGSIVKVDGSAVADKPNSNAVASLQGKVAGLTIVNSGQLNSAPDVRIRGTSSLYNTKPYYIVNGLMMDNMDFVNPNDIESMEVLKDPSSLAIYGVRGANGIIIVTTKQAKKGNV